MSSKALLAALMVAATVLAGCSDGGGKTKDDGDDLLLDEEIQATKDTGVIRGVVVDASITPLAGATVSILNTELSTTTNEQGAFGFGDLEPATYFLKITKIGYFDAQQSVDVVAGIEKPDVLKVLLEQDVASIPYVQELKFEGYIECSISTPAVRAALCDIPNIVTEEAGLGAITNDNFLAEHELDGAPRFLQSEMFWESSQALGESMSMIMDARHEDGGFEDLKVVSGTSPLMGNLNETEVIAGGLGNPHVYMLRIFNYDAPGTTPPCLVVVCPFGVGATLNQEFEILSHAFYNYQPDGEWRYSQANEVPPPPM